MSSHDHPTQDEYLEVEKKLGAAEYELASNLAQTDKTLDAAIEKGKEEAKAAHPRLKAPPEPRRGR